jgi:hypothetical protein
MGSHEHLPVLNDCVRWGQRTLWDVGKMPGPRLRTAEFASQLCLHKLFNLWQSVSISDF